MKRQTHISNCVTSSITHAGATFTIGYHSTATILVPGTFWVIGVTTTTSRHAHTVYEGCTVWSRLTSTYTTLTTKTIFGGTTTLISLEPYVTTFTDVEEYTTTIFDNEQGRQIKKSLVFPAATINRYAGVLKGNCDTLLTLMQSTLLS